MPRNSSLLIATIAFVALAVRAAPFDYSPTSARSPANWAQLQVNGTSWITCGGSAQSPIDIVFPTRADATLQPLDLFKSSATYQFVSLSNDGAQLEIRFDVIPGATMYKFSDPNDGGKSYDLNRIVFHVHGEHTVGSSRPDLEAQLVFTTTETQQVQSANGRTTSTVTSTKTLVVVTSYVASSRGAHVELDRLLQLAAWPAAPGSSEGIFAVNKATAKFPDASVGFDPFKLLPASRDYVFYQGSLTVPPCTESVRYYVFTQTSPVSLAQVDYFINLLGRNYAAPDAARIAQGNSRPVQNINGRAIRWFIDGISGKTAKDTEMAFAYPSPTQFPETRSLSIAGLVLGGLALVVSALWVPFNIRRLMGANQAAAASEKAALSAAKYKKLS